MKNQFETERRDLRQVRNCIYMYTFKSYMYVISAQLFRPLRYVIISIHLNGLDKHTSIIGLTEHGRMRLKSNNINEYKM